MMMEHYLYREQKLIPSELSKYLYEQQKEFSRKLDKTCLKVLSALGWNTQKLMAWPRKAKAINRLLYYRDVVHYTPTVPVYRGVIRIAELQQKIVVRPGFSLFFVGEDLLDVIFLETRAPRTRWEKKYFGKGVKK